MEPCIKVLLVEDNPGDALLLREAVAEIAGAPPVEWVTVGRLAEGLQRVRAAQESAAAGQGAAFDIVLLDLSLPDSQGFETFRKAYAQAGEVPIVVLTGLDDEEMAVKTVQAGAQDYLVKGQLDGHGVMRSMRYAIERCRSMQALQESERRFRAIFDQTFQLIGLLRPDGTVLESNQTALEFAGLTPSEVVGRPFWETPWWRHDPVLQAWLKEAIAAAANGQFIRSEVTHLDAAGVPQEFDFSIKPVRDESGAVVLLIPEGRDITVRKQAEEERDRLLAVEKEKSEQLKLSIREAHHRIKNNLQAISDLLYLELTAGDGASPEEALRESIDRVQAIATVHDLLSQDKDVRVVDARAVMERLVPMVLRSSGLSVQDVAIRMDVQPVPLSSKRATVLALIVNELVSNAIKHGVRNLADGVLALSLRQESEELVLRVQDNGPGLPAGFSMETHSHVGLDVVRTLAERDLNGCFSLRSQQGVLAEVRFVW